MLQNLRASVQSRQESIRTSLQSARDRVRRSASLPAQEAAADEPAPLPSRESAPTLPSRESASARSARSLQAARESVRTAFQSARQASRRSASAPASYDKAVHVSVYQSDDVSCEGATGQLQRDLANTYYWSGSFGRDYVFFIRNWHPLIGIFCCHPLHPWMKRERLGMLLIAIAMTTLPFAIRSKLMEKDSDDPIAQSIDYAAVYFYITLPIMIVGYILYYITISEAWCKDRHWCCGPLKMSVRCCRRMYFCYSSVIAIMMFFGALVISSGGATSPPYKRLLEDVLISQAQGWLTWFPIMLVLPYVGFPHGWRMEQRKEQSRARGALPSFSDAANLESFGIGTQHSAGDIVQGESHTNGQLLQS